MDSLLRTHRAGTGLAIAVAVALGGALALAALLTSGQGRGAIAVVAMGLAVVFATSRPVPALVATLAYLAVMSEVRRLLLPSLGWSGSDPLLLVGPVVVGAVMLSLVLRKRIAFDTPLSKAVAVLMAVMAVQIANPVQGSLLVGAAGALFYIVPLLWYWLGREFGDERLAERLLLRVVLPLAVLAAVYGLYQFFRGLPAHQQMWIDIGAAPAAIYTMFGVVKPFAFFEASQALAVVLSVAVVVCCVYAIQDRRWWLLALLPLLVGTLFVIASRGPWVKLMAALAMMWAVRGASPMKVLARIAPALALGLVVMVSTFQQVQQVEFSGALGAAADRQTEGLLNPLDADASTAGVHFSMLVNGLTSPLERPLGAGLGATTIAANKYGGEVLSSEVDFADLFYSLGVFGVLYLLVMGYVGGLAYRRWQAARSPVALAVLLILVLLLGEWLRGTLYFVTALVWFLIGCQERQERLLEAEAAS